MTRLRHEILLQRFRHMMVDSGVKAAAVTDVDLLKMAKGKTYEEKLAAIEAVLLIVPPGYFERRGL